MPGFSNQQRRWLGPEACRDRSAPARRQRPAVERLEDYVLLASGGLSEFPIPTASSKPPGIVTALDEPSQNATAPQVTNIVPVNSKSGRTAVTVSYNEPLASFSVGNTLIYHVVGGVVKVVNKHKMTVFTKALAIKNVSPNSTDDTVTVNLTRPFKGSIQVTVSGIVIAANGESSNLNKVVQL
jgi:hypothetical protein